MRSPRLDRRVRRHARRQQGAAGQQVDEDFVAELLDDVDRHRDGHPRDEPRQAADLDQVLRAHAHGHGLADPGRASASETRGGACMTEARRVGVDLAVPGSPT